MFVSILLRGRQWKMWYILYTRIILTFSPKKRRRKYSKCFFFSLLIKYSEFCSKIKIILRRLKLRIKQKKNNLRSK